MRTPVRTRPAAALAALSIVCGVVTLPASTASAAPTDDCGQGSWTAGSVDLCAGELVYRDYVYDDHGASLFALPDDRAEGIYSGLRAPNDAYGDLWTAGVVELAGITGQRDNTADLIALRLRVVDGRVEVSAELNTMFDADNATVVVGIDTDDDLATQAGPNWPGGLVANPFQLLPADQALANRGLDEFVVLGSGDTDTNIVTGTIPQPPGDTWRLQAVVARELPDLPVGPVVMNVAFRGFDERGNWWENAQAKALAGNDISTMSTTVAVADLVDGTTRASTVPAGLVRQRVYESSYPVGEGVRAPDGVLAKPFQFVGAIDFLGKYQPYGVVVPDTAGPHGIQFVLHGLGENHSVLLADPATAQNPPPIAKKFGLPFDRIIVVALGRGPSGFYVGAAERDFLDVLDDVRDAYPIDDERVFGGGMSMGGYGALRMSILHPDLFAAVVTWVAFTGDLTNGTPLASPDPAIGGGLGNAVDLLGNLRHVPLGAMYSGQDELVHINEALAIRDRLAELELPSAHWLHQAATHSTFATQQDYTKESAWTDGRARVVDPPRITFTTDERFYDPAFDLAPDGAYWVDEIVPAGAGYATVDAVSHGCGIGDPIMEQTSGTGVDPVPWEGQFIDPVGVEARPASNRLDLELTNIESLVIEMGDAAAAPGSRHACLSSQALDYTITTDGPTSLRFSDGRVLSLPSGVHTGVVAAVGDVGVGAAEASSLGAGTSDGASAPSRLPTTGHDNRLAIWSLVAGGVMIIRSWRRRPAGERSR